MAEPLPRTSIHVPTLRRLVHVHEYDAASRHEAERRSWRVIALTLTMMVFEIVAGVMFGSMSLLADGWHMATHGAALGITAWTYAYARRHTTDPRFTFGTGKVGVLGGFASAIVLALVALAVGVECLLRLGSPVPIQFREAIGVAALGLLVNLISAKLLGSGQDAHGRTQDHNLRGAYLHVLADAITSILAILALLAGMILGWTWMDPTIGLVGMLIIGRWSFSLLRETSRVLVDGAVDTKLADALRTDIEADADNRVADLHLWCVGADRLAALITVVTDHPREPDHYKKLVADHEELVHVTVEVHRCGDNPCHGP